MTNSPRDILRRRLDSKSARGQRTDGSHLALVLEGGGMRGVVSIAMASAFEERGFLPCFDSIHGSSAGACAGAYFAARQSVLGASIYYEDINNSKFINLFRPLMGMPVMDKDYLIDIAMKIKKPLDTGSIIGTSGLLNIVATDARTGCAITFGAYNSAEEIFGALRASVCLPLIAGHTVQMGGRELVDGGVVQQIALDSAIESGATHVIILMTRKSGSTIRPTQGIMLGVETILLRSVYGPSLANAYKERNARINSALEAIASGKISVDGRAIFVDSIARPGGSTDVGRLTTDKIRLERAFFEGRQAAFDYVDAVSDVSQ